MMKSRPMVFLMRALVVLTCSLIYLTHPIMAAAVFLPGQVTDPNCLPTDAGCSVDAFQIPSTGVVINSTTSTPSNTNNRLYDLNGVLYWSGVSLGMSTGTISSINGLSSASQSFAVSTSGTDFSVTSTGTTHTFNLPNAGSGSRGLVSAASQSFSGAKTFLDTLTASGGVILNSTLQLAALGGGLLVTDTNGNVSTTSISTLVTNSLSSSLNTMTSIVAGHTSTTTIINSVAGSSTGNMMSVTVNGTSSAGVNIINSNSLLASSSVITSTVNGVLATTSLTTSAVGEGGNLYFTSARASSSFANNFAATTTDALAEGSTNHYYTDARTRSAVSSVAAGMSYSTSSGVISLTSGYSIPLAASTTDWQAYFVLPSSRITAGLGLVWSGNTLQNTAIANLANATTDGLVSSSTQTFGGSKTFNGALSLASTFGVTGTSTLATTTATQFTASGASILSAAVTLSALGGGLLQTNSSGVVSTTSIGALTSNVLSSAANVLTSIVNGVTSTTTAVNSVSNTSSANTLSTTVNGITGLTVNIINSNSLSWSGQTLTGTINGIATAAIISFANATTDGLMSSSTQTFGGAKTFNGALSLANTLGVTGTSSLATTTVTQLTTSGASILSAALTLSALTGGLLQTSGGGVVSTTSLSSLIANTLTSSANVITSTINGMTSTTTAVNSVISTSSSNVLTLTINGVTSTTTAVNSVSNTSSGNTLTTTVNGVTGSTVNLLNSNTLTSSANVLQSVINGVGTSSVNLVNSNALSWLGQTLTSTINGVAATANISYANGTTDGLMSTTTQTFAGNKTFNGSVGVGTSPTYALDVHSTANSGVTGFFQATNSTINGIVTIQDATDATPGTSKLFAAFQGSGGSNIGTISGGVIGGVLYNSISDRRLKENISTTTLGLDSLLRIPVRDFSMKIDPEHRMTQGYIAQELYGIYPYAVSTSDGGDGELTSTGTPWAVDYGRLTPLIVKSIQEVEGQVSGLYGLTSVASSSYLRSVDLSAASFGSLTNDVAAYLKEKIEVGVKVTREIVAGRVVAIEGWFDRVTARKFCSLDSSDEVICIDGNDMKRLLETKTSTVNIHTQIPSSAPTETASTTSVVSTLPAPQVTGTSTATATISPVTPADSSNASDTVQ